MKKIFFNTVLLMFPFLLMHIINGNAQEVFFEKTDARLKTIMPSNYYPLSYPEDKWREDFMDPVPANALRTIVATQVGGRADRFSNNSESIFFTSPTGAVIPPDHVFASMINNKVINMSFWVRFENAVYTGGRDGQIFSVSSNLGGSPTLICKIIKKEIVLYCVRKAVDGELKLVPVITMDFPIDWNNGAHLPGEETNGFFFFCITAENTANGKRTRIYISRPGGRLYCRYYYFYPFEGIPANYRMNLWGGMPEQGDKPTGFDDLMFYTTGEYANRMLTPEEVLNNFYMQSPLYEGISYDIGNTHGSWNLRSQNNIDQELEEEWVGGSSQIVSQDAYGFNRFNVIKKAKNQQIYQIESMKMGGHFYTSSGHYIYMGILRPNKYFRYRRDVSNPSTMYTAGTSNFQMIEDDHLSHFLQQYESNYLKATQIEPDRSRSFFCTKAAVKVFRGPEQSYVGRMQFVNKWDNSSTGKPVGYDENVSWSYITIDKPNKDFMMANIGTSDIYYKHRYNSAVQSNFFLRRYNGRDDYVNAKYIITDDVNDCLWELVYIKEDANGKPLYLLRGSNGNANLSLGHFGDYEKYLRQGYISILNQAGSVADDHYMWSIRKR